MNLSIKEAELLKLIYQYYPKGDQYEYWQCEEYLQTAEFQRLAVVCDKAAKEQDHWIKLQKTLTTLAWLDDEPFEWTHLFRYNPCYRCEIGLPNTGYSNSPKKYQTTLFVNISVIAPLYALYISQTTRYYTQRVDLPGLPDELKNRIALKSTIYFPAETPMVYESNEDKKIWAGIRIIGPADPLPPSRNTQQDLAYVNEIQNCIESIFTGYQPMPLELVNKCVPDIIIDSYEIGEASFFHALFTTHVW
jgi:hypothetical protein